MKQMRTLLFFCFSAIIACTPKKDSPTTETKATIEPDIDLISDFEVNRHIFRTDTFELYNQSTDGGELIAFHSNDKDYIVVDVWLYGETGKLHATFWTDKDLNIKIARRIMYEYDRPYYEGDFKTTETTDHVSFVGNDLSLSESQKKELNEKRTEIQKLFKDVTEEAKIVK